MGLHHPNHDDLQELGLMSVGTGRGVLLMKPVPAGREHWSCQQCLPGLPGTIALLLLSLMVPVQMVALK